MRKLFNIPAERETRLWNKYMSNTYEQLSKLDNTVQDAGLYQGQVGGQACPRAAQPGRGQCQAPSALSMAGGRVRTRTRGSPFSQVLVIEPQNEDGTWPRQALQPK